MTETIIEIISVVISAVTLLIVLINQYKMMKDKEPQLLFSLRSIDNAAFRKSSIKSVTIPASLTSIGKVCFAETQLTSATFENPNGWTAIMEGDESTLTSLTLTNASTNASYLRYGGSNYANYVWTRN